MTVLNRKFPDVTGFCWSIEHGVRLYSGVHEPRTYTDVSIETLQAIHPRLPELIEMKAAGYKPKPDTRVYLPLSVFEPDLALWTGATVTMKDIIGFSKIISSIKSCDIDPTNTIVKFDVELFETEDWWPDVEPQPVPRVVRVYDTNIATSRALLDRAYPGWHDRFVQGEALGVDSSTLLQHMFLLELPPPSIGMSDVSFQ